MKGIEFKELDLIADTEKGQLFEFDNRKTTDRLMLVTRKAGTVSGYDFHKGKHPNKNPEIGVIISGTVEFYCKNSAGEEVTNTFDKPIMYIIQKNIFHEVRAITDISFIEFSAAADGKGDSFKRF